MGGKKNRGILWLNFLKLNDPSGFDTVLTGLPKGTFFTSIILLFSTSVSDGIETAESGTLISDNWSLLVVLSETGASISDDSSLSWVSLLSETGASISDDSSLA